VASAVGTLALHGFIGYWLIFVGQKPMRFADGQVAVTPFSLTLINPVSASASKNEPEIPQLTRDAAWRTLKASLIDLDPPPHLKITTESSPEGPRQSTMTADAASFLRMCRSRYPDSRQLSVDLARTSLQDSASAADGRERRTTELSDTEQSPALVALHCLQAFGTLGGRPVG
jgi:hypothetical protein